MTTGGLFFCLKSHKYFDADNWQAVKNERSTRSAPFNPKPPMKIRNISYTLLLSMYIQCLNLYSDTTRNGKGYSE